MGFVSSRKLIQKSMYRSEGIPGISLGKSSENSLTMGPTQWEEFRSLELGILQYGIENL